MIALLQQLHGPGQMHAVLVRTRTSATGTAWQTEDWTATAPERQAWHQRKMASKLTRPAAQLAHLGLAPGSGRVEHLDLSSGP